MADMQLEQRVARVDALPRILAEMLSERDRRG